MQFTPKNFAGEEPKYFGLQIVSLIVNIQRSTVLSAAKVETQSALSFQLNYAN